MLEHRNHWLRHKSSFFHKKELQACNDSTHFEFAIGLNGLMNECDCFFRGKVQDLIKKPVCFKAQCLASVWDGRDRIRRRDGLEDWREDPLSAAFLVRDRVRKKK